MYLDEEGPIKPVEVLDDICHTMPVHVILGDSPDFMYVSLPYSVCDVAYLFISLHRSPKFVHQALINPSSGRHFASITTINNVGHLVGFPFSENIFFRLSV